MSWSLLASVGAALVAGALLPRASGRTLGRLRSARSAPRLTAGGRPPWRERWSGRLIPARRAGQVRAGLIELADALSAELRAGAAPREAMHRAARDQPCFALVAAAARSPVGDVESALREVSTLAGAGAAADLATAWVVCEAAGGRLAAPVARLAGAWRDEEQVRREVRAQLAGPRATAVLLAGLPLVGLAMGAALGAHPVAMLRQPSIALPVLVPGVFLQAAGLLWTARITRRAATW